MRALRLGFNDFTAECAEVNAQSALREEDWEIELKLQFITVAFAFSKR